MSVLTRLSLLAGAVAALFPVTASAAPSSSAADTGVQVSYHPASSRYCVRLTRYDATMPSGLGLYRRSCRTEQQWGRIGVTFARRSAPVAMQ